MEDSDAGHLRKHHRDYVVPRVRHAKQSKTVHSLQRAKYTQSSIRYDNHATDTAPPPEPPPPRPTFFEILRSSFVSMTQSTLYEDERGREIDVELVADIPSQQPVGTPSKCVGNVDVDADTSEETKL